ncbi:hypothetical protein AAHH67_15280 [Niallia circulans]
MTDNDLYKKSDVLLIQLLMKHIITLLNYIRMTIKLLLTNGTEIPMRSMFNLHM